MTTIACVKWGNLYGPEYVNNLSHAAMRHLSKYHRFVCFTDDPSGLGIGIETRPLPLGIAGWWNKLALFKGGTFEMNERVLFIDLDTLIIDSIDELADYAGEFACLSDFYRPGGYGSGLMAWTPSRATETIWNSWDAAGRPEIDGGDQAWIEQILPLQPDLFQALFPGKVVSYKVDCFYAPPPVGTSVVCFHGTPKPHERVNRKWVRDAWTLS